MNKDSSNTLLHGNETLKCGDVDLCNVTAVE